MRRPSPLCSVLVSLLASWGLVGCTASSNFLGFDEVAVTPEGGSGGTAVVGGTGASMDDAGVGGTGPAPDDDDGDDDEDDDDGGDDDDAYDDDADNDDDSSGAGADSGGASGAGPEGGSAGQSSGGDPGLDAMVPLEPLVANPNPTNYLVSVLGYSEEEVTSRIDTMYEQLFHGDSVYERIYYELDEDEAYVFDILHDDTRADALGYGLLISVELDRQEEFDKIWNFTHTRMRYEDGPFKGYFHGECDLDSEPCDAEVGVLGSYYIVTALLMAEARWGNGIDVYEYGAHAREYLDWMRGVSVDGVDRPPLFSLKEYLPSAYPGESEETATGWLTTAFFEYWGAKTDIQFYTRVARRSRDFMVTSPHYVTGLAPRYANPDGTAAVGGEYFDEYTYPFHLNLSVDYGWYAADDEQVALADRVIRFFAGAGDKPYPGEYVYSGQALDEPPSGALFAVNGAIASIASVQARKDFMQRVWLTPTPVGLYRYFDGTQLLLAMLHLSGQWRAY